MNKPMKGDLKIVIKQGRTAEYFSVKTSTAIAAVDNFCRMGTLHCLKMLITFSIFLLIS
jgi:hypothetical protein